MSQNVSSAAVVIGSLRVKAYVTFFFSVDYCPDDKEQAIPHPYEDCTKFIWCLPGDLVVQPCPFGTCFSEITKECVRI